jgi:integrase
MQTTGKPKKRPAKNAKTASWSDAVDGFMTNLEHSDSSSHTTHHYRDDLRAFSDWWRKASPAEVLTPGAITDYDLREWQRHLKEEKLSEEGRKRKPATINAKMAAVKSFLRWAHEARVIKVMPAAPKPRKLGRRSVKRLGTVQQRELLRLASRDRNPRNPAMVEILIETGLRVAELVALCWRDVETSDRKGTLEIREGKGCKHRRVALSPEALRAFKKLRELDPKAAPDDRVFTSQRKDAARPGRNKPLSIRGVQELLSRYAEALKWDHLHPHQLRHTCAVNLRAGRSGRPPMDWPLIRDFLGHESVKTTMDHYATPGEDEQQAAVNPDADDDFDDE